MNRKHSQAKYISKLVYLALLFLVTTLIFIFLGAIAIDSDNDGLSELEESCWSTDPNNGASDDYGVLDGDASKIGFYLAGKVSEL